jgi:hypothetical protein
MFIDTLLACLDPIVHPLAAYQTPAIGRTHVLETRTARGFTSPETFSPSKGQVNLKVAGLHASILSERYALNKMPFRAS